MSTRAAACVAAGIAALALPAFGQAPPATPGVAAASSRSNWNEPTAPFKIIDNVYYVGTAACLPSCL